MPQKRKQGRESAFMRMMEASECSTQVELAQFLGISQPAISAAQRRKTVPAEWLVKLVCLKGIHPDWVRTGKEPRCLKSTPNCLGSEAP